MHKVSNKKLHLQKTCTSTENFKVSLPNAKCIPQLQHKMLLMMTIHNETLKKFPTLFLTVFWRGLPQSQCQITAIL